MPILTTTIGAYPKPDYAPVLGWYERRNGHQDNPTKAYSDYLKEKTAETEAAFADFYIDPNGFATHRP